MWNTAAPSLLAAALFVSGVSARECGTAITKECKSSYDIRYNNQVSTNLTTHSPAWEAISGYYSGILYNYHPTDYLSVEVTPDKRYKYPTEVYLNVTVSGTRVYRHVFMFRNGADPANPDDTRVGLLRVGQQVQCDSVGIATWEKDGIAKNLRTICSTDNSLDKETLEEDSKGYPISDSAVKFDEIFRPSNNANAELVTLSTTYKCVSSECESISVIEEQFEENQRVSFQIADLERIDEGNFTSGVNGAPEDYIAPETDSVWLPMTASCLNVDRCYTERDICAQGDPSDYCRENHRPVFVERYQEEDGEVRTGVIIAFTLSAVIFVVGVLLVVYAFLRNKQAHRYRYFFAIRMLDVMQTDKHLDEFTADDLNREYSYLQTMLRGAINQEMMYEFLSTGELGYMDWGDFAALWEHLDQNKSGQAGFLEFTSFLGHCWAEIEAVKADRAAFEEENGDSPADEG